MKIFFWKKNRIDKNEKNKITVVFTKLNKEKQDEALKKGAKDFSDKFTNIVDKLSNE